MQEAKKRVYERAFARHTRYHKLLWMAGSAFFAEVFLGIATDCANNVFIGSIGFASLTFMIYVVGSWASSLRNSGRGDRQVWQLRGRGLSRRTRLRRLLLRRAAKSRLQHREACAAASRREIRKTFGAVWLAGRRFSWNRRKRRLRAGRASFQALLAPGATQAMHAAIGRVAVRPDGWKGRRSALLLRWGSRGSGALVPSPASTVAVPCEGHEVRESRRRAAPADGARLATRSHWESLGIEVCAGGNTAAAPFAGDFGMTIAADVCVDVQDCPDGLLEDSGLPVVSEGARSVLRTHACDDKNRLQTHARAIKKEVKTHEGVIKKGVEPRGKATKKGVRAKSSRPCYFSPPGLPVDSAGSLRCAMDVIAHYVVAAGWNGRAALSALLADFRHDAWLGVRVGEASHPGPRSHRPSRVGLTKADVRRLVKSMVMELASPFFAQGAGLPRPPGTPVPDADYMPTRAVDPGAGKSKGKDGKGKAPGKDGKGKAQGKGKAGKDGHRRTLQLPATPRAEMGGDARQSTTGGYCSRGPVHGKGDPRLGDKGKGKGPEPTTRARRWRNDGWQEVKWKLRAGDLNFTTVITQATDLERELDKGDPVLAYADTDKLLEEFGELMRGGCVLRGGMKIRRCWVVAWTKGQPEVGELLLDVEVDFIEAKAPKRSGTTCGVVKGLLRLSPTAARSLLAAGGRILGGTTFFCQPLRRSDLTLNQPALLWETQWADETSVQYLRRVVASTGDMGLFHDGKKLAVRIGPRDPRNAAKQGLWHLRQVPMGWHVLELEEVLKDVGFEQIEIQARYRERRSTRWSFLALRADRQDYVPIKLEDEVLARPKDDGKGGSGFFNAAPAQSASEFPPDPFEDLITLDEASDWQAANDDNQMMGNKRPAAATAPVAKKPKQPKIELPSGATVISNDGGGNCLPAAVAQALTSHGGKPVSHRGRAMTRWMREQTHHLQPLIWDGRDTNDQPCQMPFTEYLSAVEAVGSWCGNLEVYALSRGLPANLLIINYDSETTFKFASQADSDPFVVLKYSGRHDEWVKCSPEALVDIWCHALVGNTTEGHSRWPHSTYDHRHGVREWHDKGSFFSGVFGKATCSSSSDGLFIFSDWRQAPVLKDVVQDPSQPRKFATFVRKHKHNAQYHEGRGNRRRSAPLLIGPTQSIIGAIGIHRSQLLTASTACQFSKLGDKATTFLWLRVTKKSGVVSCHRAARCNRCGIIATHAKEIANHKCDPENPSWSAETARRRIRLLKERRKLAEQSGISASDADFIWKRAEEMLFWKPLGWNVAFPEGDITRARTCILSRQPGRTVQLSVSHPARVAAFLTEIIEGGSVQKLLIVSYYGFANDPQLSSDLLEEVGAQALMLGFPWIVCGDFQAPAHEQPAAALLSTGTACNLDLTMHMQARFPPRAQLDSTESTLGSAPAMFMPIGYCIARALGTTLP
ncbi:unnamed protein product [Symbiodinium sp. CCMP2592]|nr:unnamed protein product [Symbiodinium sp. CCMP2592]